MATSTALTRAREHIERLSDAAVEAIEFRVGVLDELRHTIGFDAHVWLMTDPVTCVGSAPLADVPTFGALPTTIRLKYLTEANRWTQLAADGVTASALGSGRDRSRLWSEQLSRYGIGDVASGVYADRHGCWGFLDLWRLDSAAPFGADECRFLADIAEPVTTALRGCVGETFLAPAVPQPRELGPVVLLLDDDLQVLTQTPASQDWLDTLLPATDGRSPVPAGAYNVAAQLLAVEAGVDAHAATTRVHFGEGFWVTARAARLDAGIAVTLEESSPSERLDLYARASGLSRREAELLTHLATGGATRDLATLMTVSENTVQDHLKSVFDKTGARTRTALLARALGVRPGGAQTTVTPT